MFSFLPGKIISLGKLGANEEAFLFVSEGGRRRVVNPKVAKRRNPPGSGQQGSPICEVREGGLDTGW